MSKMEWAEEGGLTGGGIMAGRAQGRCAGARRHATTGAGGGKGAAAPKGKRMRMRNMVRMSIYGVKGSN